MLQILLLQAEKLADIVPMVAYERVAKVKQFQQKFEQRKHQLYEKRNHSFL
ncbi:hypothetical protein [Spirosoma montaniterrae]|uniref:hypothetical protein n=1 Tax=Spirosoma montaniterrae TaxID=1178516 RepID=UPI0012FA2C7B|nr:hypothetical protein [Spirosoma montaniterrae]